MIAAVHVVFQLADHDARRVIVGLGTRRQAHRDVGLVLGRPFEGGMMLRGCWRRPSLPSPPSGRHG